MKRKFETSEPIEVVIEWTHWVSDQTVLQTFSHSRYKPSRFDKIPMCMWPVEAVLNLKRMMGIP